ncbi:hypothetical protein Poli38472_006004 [Pythium oligandrum]|uniref:Uncharacterized protein n=1 Tax=Pythium oligandrum TaxID=41045 RepID=A0A8K1FMR6_PYTOL|nr:hypothetical protein Poli38472_006004 [Pythium oligandrum]|eukprot:TMW68536.1 hypothetical protein Poli38472_006004 [Pythium oligandrum]
MKRKAAVKGGARGKASQAQMQKKKKTLSDDAFDWSGARGGGRKEDAILSDSDADDDDEGHAGRGGESSSDDEEEEMEARETAQEKRLRLAKEYLSKITEQEDDEEEDTTGVEERVTARLHQDALEAMGKLFKQVASKYEEFEFDTDSTRFLKGHKLPVTALCLSEDGKTAFSAAKDGTILRWDLATQTKTKLLLPKDDISKATKDHERCVLALALNSDGKYLASGGYDKLLRVWDAEKNEVIETFQGHRDKITSLAFRLRSNMLLSGSLDRTIKHWNLTEMGYVETLFGHQAEVNGLDALYKERVVSCGRDRSVRMWKIPEETQLVFYGNTGSMDCVKMINDEYYVTGGDDGSLSLWFNGRKKPAYVVPNAHGAGRWISSVTVMPRTDLVASGSCDGSIRLWRADLGARTLEPVGEIPLEGFVNGLCFDQKGRFLLAGVGQEHRLGRWERIKHVKNGLAIIALPSIEEANDDVTDSSEDEDMEEADAADDNDDGEDDE